MLVACQAQGGMSTTATPAEPRVTLETTETPGPTATAVRTPPNLPPQYRSPLLNPLDEVHTYLQDDCQYLRDKWGPDKAAPGTVVMVVMLRSINQGKAEGQGAITDTAFARMLAELHGQHFEAINMVQLDDFLESNAKIPARSVALIQDGRRYAENFSKHFRSYWDEWGWPVINAWDMQANTTEALWSEQAALESEGWVDHQVFGPTINADGPPLSDPFVTDQLQAPMAAFRQHFRKAPIAVIWPSGLDRRSAQAQRAALGYRLGFTINPRGPLMFNWVPLAELGGHVAPLYFPEGSGRRSTDDPAAILAGTSPSESRCRSRHGRRGGLSWLGKTRPRKWRTTISCAPRPTAPSNRLEARRHSADTRHLSWTDLRLSNHVCSAALSAGKLPRPSCIGMNS